MVKNPSIILVLLIFTLFSKKTMQNQLMVAVLVAGLVVIPSMEQAFADNGNHFGKIRNGNNGKHLGRGGPEI